MSIRLEKPWIDLTADNVATLRGELGVYQIADEPGEIVFIGYAGGRSLFGLKGELQAALERYRGQAMHFRVEVTSQYLSRHEELLMIHKHDHGELPRDNHAERKRKTGRIAPG
jgi:hypothetical protein